MKFLKYLTIVSIIGAFLLNSSFKEKEYLHIYPKKYKRLIKKKVKKALGIRRFQEVEVWSNNPKQISEIHKIFVKNTFKGYYIVTLANACKIGGCSQWKSEDDVNVEFEQYYFLTVYNPMGEIQDINVFEYPSEYGHEIKQTSWLAQFFYKKGDFFKTADQVDAISGATVSVSSIVDNLNKQQKLIPNNKEYIGIKEAEMENK